MMIMVVPYLKHSIKNIVRSTSFVIALGLFIYHGGWPCDLCQGQSIQGQSQKKLAFRPRPRITIPGTYTVYWRVCVCVCVCVCIRHVCVGTPVNPAKRMRPPRRRRGRGANLHRTKEPCIGWAPGSPTRTSADRSPSPLESSLQADSVVDAGVPRCRDLCGVGDAAWPAWHGSDCRVRHRKRKCAKNCNK